MLIYVDFIIYRFFFVVDYEFKSDVHILIFIICMVYWKSNKNVKQIIWVLLLNTNMPTLLGDIKVSKF